MNSKWIVAGIAMLFSATGAYALTITGIDFKQDGGKSTLEIKADGPITINKSENLPDKQVVLDIGDAKISKSVNR
ncbi:MAG: hypothetical protein AAB425_09350, partial [Bdellovibrionota bacterium]